jgi:NADPH:quinone reductase-like Zn-dependent oxidoreductase
MRAWQYSGVTGGLEKNLVLADAVPLPTVSSRLGDGELLVQVLSAGLNPADYKVPELGLVARTVIRLPATPGMDFCGRVAQATRTVDDFAIGDLVFGRLDPQQHGATGEYIVAPTKACAHVPQGVAVDEAAAIGVAGMTAYRTFLSLYLSCHGLCRRGPTDTAKQRLSPPMSSRATRSSSTAAQEALAPSASRLPKPSDATSR